MIIPENFFESNESFFNTFGFYGQLVNKCKLSVLNNIHSVGYLLILQFTICNLITDNICI